MRVPPPSSDGGNHVICRFHNPVGRGLAPAVAYDTTNLGHLVGAIHESPVYRAVKGVGVGIQVVCPIPCLRARFFAPLKNDSARKITTTPHGQTRWYGLKAVKRIPCLQAKLD